MSLCTTAFAQTDDINVVVKITTQFKQKFTGDLIQITADSILIYDEELGVITFAREDIQKFKVDYSNYPFKGVTTKSAPFYVQTAIPNGKGNHYYKNYYLFGNELTYGVTDYMNISAGFEIASIFSNVDNDIPVLQLGTKIGKEIVTGIHLGASTMAYFNDKDFVHIIGPVLTLGNNINGITISPTYVNIADEDPYLGMLANVNFGISENVRMVIDFASIDGETIGTSLLECAFNRGFALSFGTLFADGGWAPVFSFSIPFGNWAHEY